MRSGKAVVFLSPLLVLLPTWLIFFDKATSINRIVGYMRIIEAAILWSRLPSGFLGWENALAEYRRRHGEFVPDSTAGWHFHDITKYHGIVFMTYLLLVVTCIWLGWTETTSDVQALGLWWVLLIASGVTLFVNARYIFELSWGKYSSRAEHLKWRKILYQPLRITQPYCLLTPPIPPIS